MDQESKKELQLLREELDRTAKMLVKRDLALMRANEHLKELDRAKSEFVSIAAHQLRTPLTSIKWFSEMLMNSIGDTLAEQPKKNLTNIMQASEHMGDLINSLLSVSRLELGTLEQYIEPVDMIKLITKVTDDLDGIRAKNNIKKKCTINKENAVIQTDRQLMEMILHNLISNAYKYTPKDGSVTIEYECVNEKNIVIRVIDTGFGIPKNEQKNVFTKFYRASNIRDGADGTGLGLHITQMSAKQLGGELTMHSVENEGTTFTITLPYIKADTFTS